MLKDVIASSASDFSECLFYLKQCPESTLNNATSAIEITYHTEIPAGTENVVFVTNRARRIQLWKQFEATLANRADSRDSLAQGHCRFVQCGMRRQQV